MPKYSVEGKILKPLTPREFLRGMAKGIFIVIPQHRALVAFLYYSGVRISEALRLETQNCTLEQSSISIDIGPRLKKRTPFTTPPLTFNLDLPYIEDLIRTLELTKPGRLLWPYTRKTGYNIVRRVFKYPHYFRLNRITHFFSPSEERPEGYSIAEVRAWTGLSLRALDYYVGLASVRKMGQGLK